MWKKKKVISEEEEKEKEEYKKKENEKCKECRFFEGCCKHPEMKGRMKIGGCDLFKKRWPEGLKRPEDYEDW